MAIDVVRWYGTKNKAAKELAALFHGNKQAALWLSEIWQDIKLARRIVGEEAFNDSEEQCDHDADGA